MDRIVASAAPSKQSQGNREAYKPIPRSISAEK
jgi:hypothetical protein